MEGPKFIFIFKCTYYEKGKEKEKSAEISQSCHFITNKVQELTPTLRMMSMSRHKNVIPYANDEYVSSRLQFFAVGYNVASRIGIKCTTTMYNIKNYYVLGNFFNKSLG